MQSYSPPAYPTRGANPAAVLKKLPIRWAKNAAIIACLGALSLGALTGCGETPQTTATGPVPYSGETENTVETPATYPFDQYPYATLIEERAFDIFVRTHHGGSGGGPIYVAHLTEQEALGIVRNALEEAGFDFSSNVPAHEIEWWPTETLPIHLYDAQKNRAVVFADLPHNNWTWQFGTERELEQIHEGFAQQTDLPVEVFYCEGYILGWSGFGDEHGEWIAPIGGRDDWDAEFDVNTTKEEQLRLAGPALEQSLLTQVQAFIDQLRGEGVLPE